MIVQPGQQLFLVESYEPSTISHARKPPSGYERVQSAARKSQELSRFAVTEIPVLHLSSLLKVIFSKVIYRGSRVRFSLTQTGFSVRERLVKKESSSGSLGLCVPALLGEQIGRLHNGLMGSEGHGKFLSFERLRELENHGDKLNG